MCRGRSKIDVDAPGGVGDDRKSIGGTKLLYSCGRPSMGRIMNAWYATRGGYYIGEHRFPRECAPFFSSSNACFTVNLIIERERIEQQPILRDR